MPRFKDDFSEVIKETEKASESFEGVFKYYLEYNLTHPENSSFSEKGVAFLKKDTLEVRGASGRYLSFPLRDIISFRGKDYRVTLNLLAGSILELNYLGRNYGDFLDELTCTRNNVIKRDLLMHESLLFVAEDLEYGYFDSQNQIVSKGSCNAQVSDTALVIATPEGHFIKFPLSYVNRIVDESYSLSISMDTKEGIVLKMLGRQREPLLFNLQGAIKKLEDKALTLCENLFGNAAKQFMAELAILFKDGRAVSKKRLDSFSPELWAYMEQRLESCGLIYSYQILRTLGIEEDCTIGFKRGLMGDLTGEYIWFLIPIKGKQIIAMEAGMTDGEGGKATYFFKVSNTVNIDFFIQQINYCLFMINFRREPIYLTDEQLKKSAHKEYEYAIEKLPSLRLLRNLFIGRVMHTSEDQWKDDVEGLIRSQC